jgi:GT2 family glycosyltransferase
LIRRRFKVGLRARASQWLRKGRHFPELPDAVGAVDVMAAVDEQSYYLDGWIADEEGASISIVAESEDKRLDLTTRVFRYLRPDLAEVVASGDYGVQGVFAFACFFQLDAPAMAPTRWWLKVRDSNGVVKKLETPALIREPGAVKDSIVARLKYEHPFCDDLMKNHVAPALSRLQTRLRGAAEAESVIEYGPAAPSPTVSIVVPIHRRIDLIENQLSQFAGDPEIPKADLIYVLDSPELAGDLLDVASHLFDVYRVPFRIAFLERHVGYAGATNVGASLSRGNVLLLLHSDVLPGEPGWLEKMRSSYEENASAGVLGPKLLFEDDTIQHAGISFARSPDSSLWERSLCYKGLHGSLPRTRVPRPVVAVTGACLMINHRLYHDLGALRGDYLEPDYEALDLQLRLRKAGARTWYAADINLYHLEERSASPEIDRLYGRYDAWLLTQRWGEHEELLSEPTTGSDAWAY